MAIRERSWWYLGSAIVLGIVACASTAIPPTRGAPSTTEVSVERDARSFAPSLSETAAPVAKGDRILAIDVNPAEDGDFEKAFETAKRAGMQAVSLTVSWDDIEAKPSVYDAEAGSLPTANVYYPLKGVKVNLIVTPFEAAGKRVPSDLKALPMTDARVIARFKKFLDYVFSQLSAVDLNLVAIGNEVDLASGDKKTLWGEYTDFSRQAVEYVKQKKPGVGVGVPGTLYGLTGSAKVALQKINEYTTVVLATYYPIKEDFSVKDPGIVTTEIGSLLAVYPGKKVAIVETGYPSAAVLGSSEARQGEFVRNMFRVWDANASRIHTVTFAWLNDLSPSEAESYGGHYAISDSKFREYLRTLGMRTYPGAGKNKPAFDALQAEAAARGWKG